MAQNWNIDVAKDLEEYLEELESIQISFDGGKTTLNFAEAAMLIQVGAAAPANSNRARSAVVCQTVVRNPALISSPPRSHFPTLNAGFSCRLQPESRVPVRLDLPDIGHDNSAAKEKGASN